jgi:hypothetical protein
VILARLRRRHHADHMIGSDLEYLGGCVVEQNLYVAQLRRQRFGIVESEIDCRGAIPLPLIVSNIPGAASPARR